MKTLLFILFLSLAGTPPILAQTPSKESNQSIGFTPIVVKVMNRGTNILMSASFLFILLYTIYVAIAVSFGSMKAHAFLSLFWGSGIIFAGGALAKIYYLFLS